MITILSLSCVFQVRLHSLLIFRRILSANKGPAKYVQWGDNNSVPFIYRSSQHGGWEETPLNPECSVSTLKSNHSKGYILCIHITNHFTKIKSVRGLNGGQPLHGCMVGGGSTDSVSLDGPHKGHPESQSWQSEECRHCKQVASSASNKTEVEQAKSCLCFSTPPTRRACQPCDGVHTAPYKDVANYSSPPGSYRRHIVPLEWFSILHTKPYYRLCLPGTTHYLE